MRCGASEEEPGRSITTFEYLKAKDLSAFLERPAKPDGSMLQRFVDPRGEYNTAIRADWSPQMLVLEQRENVCRLADQGLDHYQRVVTFEGAAHNSLSGAVKQHSTALRLRQACESIADHLATTGSRQARPLRMVLFFKVGTAARVCLRVRLLRDVLPLCMCVVTAQQQECSQVAVLCLLPHSSYSASRFAGIIVCICPVLTRWSVRHAEFCSGTSLAQCDGPRLTTRAVSSSAHRYARVNVCLRLSARVVHTRPARMCHLCRQACLWLRAAS